MEKEQNIALLIDCDNVSYRAISGVLDELAKYGVINIRRAYGNWKSSNMQGWEAQLHPYAIMPVQQFSYTSGKNATDIAMVIDAMDLLYTKTIDAFALMTSDSDFTPIVMRILSNGLKVYGFGERKTPESFVNACSLFIYTENLELLDDEMKTKDVQNNLKYSKNKLRGDTGLVKSLRMAVEQTAGDDGWSYFSTMVQYISNNTSFSPLNYGYKKWIDLIRVSELFEVEMRSANVMYIRDKRKK